ncbi:S8 family serine peptidase [Pontiellaceae bacterium B12219]|nr:S8 family serine peptidase [Pontiellaceae bacterium B12219]
MKKIGLALSIIVTASFAEEVKPNTSPQSTQQIKDGKTKRYTRAMFELDAKTMRDARKKRADILSKRHNMRDKQSRDEVVRQLKDAEEERMGAVRRRAAAGGWKVQGKYSDGRGFQLIDFDEHGLPVYEEDQNVNAAITTAADQVRSSAIYNEVDGSSVTIAVYKGGWDNMEGGTLAKNSIAVGWAADGLDDGGNRDPVEAKAQKWSCRGPADDGRIKPDIYGNGSGLRSSTAGSDTSTASYSGTSMSSPNCCGSAALLVDYYSSRFPGESMRASTLKALILHTADDRSPTGPDYKYGWGIMNTQAAADVIKAHADSSGGGVLLESLVDTNITSRTHTFGWDGTSPLRVTLCWTDPASPQIYGHDNRTKALVNDLNLKVIGPDGTHYPYVMPYVADGDWDENKIDDKATTGVNDVDNVEQVYLAAPVAGDYQIVVDYVGTLTNDEQIYSLVVTGQTAPELTEFESWRLANFGTTNASGTMADDADFDEDGIANLLEFGLATSPKETTVNPLMFRADLTDAQLTYPRNLNSTNEYDVEMIWSDNLMSNNWSAIGVIENILSESGSVQQVESSLPMGGTSNRYFRLRIKKK